MRNAVDERWAIAMERAAGREAGAVTLPEDLLLLARRLLDVGRRVEALPPCPSTSLRRALALAVEAPASTRPPVWSLLFDSWAAAAPAMRGASTTRFLRCGGDGGTIDVEMGETTSGALRVRGTVDAGEADLALDVATDGARTLRVPVRPGGLFEATVPASRHGFTLTLRSGRRVLGRTPPLPPAE